MIDMIENEKQTNDIENVVRNVHIKNPINIQEKNLMTIHLVMIIKNMTSVETGLGHVHDLMTKKNLAKLSTDQGMVL